MEEFYREESGKANDRKVLAAVVLLVVIGYICWTVMKYMRTGYFQPIDWGFSFLALAIYIWRVSFGYTVILYKNKTMEVITHGLGINRSYTIDLTRTESFTNKYERSFFRKTKIGHYIHRYDSLDPNPQRLLVFTEGKKNSLAGIIFKGSDTLMKKLYHMMPDKYIQL